MPNISICDTFFKEQCNNIVLFSCQSTVLVIPLGKLSAPYYNNCCILLKVTYSIPWRNLVSNYNIAFWSDLNLFNAFHFTFEGVQKRHLRSDFAEKWKACLVILRKYKFFHQLLTSGRFSRSCYLKLWADFPYCAIIFMKIAFALNLTHNFHQIMTFVCYSLIKLTAASGPVINSVKCTLKQRVIVFDCYLIPPAH